MSVLDRVSNPAELPAGTLTELFLSAVEKHGYDLARYERLKKMGLIAAPFTVDGGTLTPTQKVKRRVVKAQFRKLIEALCREENFDQTVFVEE